jgi:hypothetical protein
MRQPSRALPLLLTALLVLAPIASAEPMLPLVVDERIGEVDEGLQSANSTYGNRSEFQRSAASLQRASISLVNDAWIVALDEVIKSSGGLETGKARAQASGADADEEVVDHGRQLASEARSEVTKVRDNLDSMDRTPLEPVALSGALTAGFAANKAMDLLREYDAALNQWEQGERGQQVEAAIVSNAAGARIAALTASDVLSRTAEARANATATDPLSAEELDELVEDRVTWTEANHVPLARKSHDRVISMDEQGEDLMALSAFTIYFQDAAFNGAKQQKQQGEDIDPFHEARDLHDRDGPTVREWVDELGVAPDIPVGAMASADFSLELNQNATGDVRFEAGAYSLGLAHLGVEHTGLLMQAYTSQSHDPGTELASVGEGEDESGFASIPAAGAVLAIALMAVAAAGRDRW